MFYFLTHLFDPAGFTPRWDCGMWTPAHGWLHILSDLGVWSAYVAIPFVLAYFVVRRRDIPFRLIFVLFVAFIFACGTTHLMEAIIFWWPVYRLAGLIKLGTALVSWATVIALVPVVPKVLAMRGPEELEREIAARQQAEQALQAANAELEQRVEERTAALVQANAALEQERAKLRERAAELETVMSVVPAAIWIAYDPDCRRLVGNLPACQLLKMPEHSNPSASVPGQRPFREFRNGQPVPPHELPIQTAAATGTEVRGAALDMVFDDGEVRHIYGNAVPLFDAVGKPRGAVAAFLDITELKRAELALKEADQRKDEFLATLAHELRNPLAPIRNAVQILRALGPADPHLQQIRDMIARQVNHMVRLVDDLMDVSRITRGKIDLKMERVDIAAVVQSAVETSRPLIDAGRHELTLTLPSQPVQVVGDLTRLAQVMANLLNNATKFTPEGGRLALTVETVRDQVVVRIRDNGIGIPATMLPRVFEMFTQVDQSIDRAHGGLGIGLTLVKRLVEMHGGTIEAHSEGAGRGSEFIVSLPLAGAAVPPPHADRAAAAPSRGAGRRVLVVDDNHDSAESLGMLLGFAGHRVELAYDGPSALTIAKDFRPEVVLLDIGLPGMSGYEVARQMRALPELQGVVLAAQTGWGQEDDRRLSREAGFDAHLVKPVDLEAVQRLLATAGRAK